jgi:hypothetical protein
MGTRPYAVEIWRDKLSVHRAARRGETLTEGYFLARGRYATRNSAEKQAQYYNLFNPVRQARVVEL